MATSIFKLVGSIFVDTEEANKNIEKTDQKAEGLGNKLLSGIGTAAKWGAGLATAAASGAVAPGAVAVKSAGVPEVFDIWSQRLGLSALSSDGRWIV